MNNGDNCLTHFMTSWNNGVHNGSFYDVTKVLACWQEAIWMSFVPAGMKLKWLFILHFILVNAINPNLIFQEIVPLIPYFRFIQKLPFFLICQIWSMNAILKRACAHAYFHNILWRSEVKRKGLMKGSIFYVYNGDLPTTNL